MSLQNKRAVWTTHALERADFYSIKMPEMLQAWRDSTLSELPKELWGFKFEALGMSIVNDIYLYDHKTDILFTCVKKWNKGKEGLVVITVTRKNKANKQ
jgi:hypothetical protein